MGVMRFIVPPEQIERLPELRESYLGGVDGRVFPTRIERTDNLISAWRQNSDSAKFHVAWPLPGIGRPILTTTSLREREEPYLLPLELARGELAEVREQAAAWEQQGMELPDSFIELQKQSFQQFARASSLPKHSPDAAELADEAIQLACRAAVVLMDAYVIQRAATRGRSSAMSPSLLGCTLGESVMTEHGAAAFSCAFNFASVPISWRAVSESEGHHNWEDVDRLLRWCSERRLVVRGGPLIDLGPSGLPDWLSAWRSDPANLPSFACDFIESAVQRYSGLVRIWEVAAYGNTGGALDLSEEQRLALVARSLEAARRTETDTPFFIRVDQPWGEYQRFGKHRLSPFQFVDALIRSNLGLSGIVLEINCGYGPSGCGPRDILGVSRMIDLWSMLGVQLHVDLACPSEPTADPMAAPQFTVQNGIYLDRWSEETQSEWIEQIVPVLLAKSSVTAVSLSQFSDIGSHRFPHGGLLSAEGDVKTMLDPWIRLRHHELS